MKLITSFILLLFSGVCAEVPKPAAPKKKIENKLSPQEKADKLHAQAAAVKEEAKKFEALALDFQQKADQAKEEAAGLGIQSEEAAQSAQAKKDPLKFDKEGDPPTNDPFQGLKQLNLVKDGQEAEDVSAMAREALKAAKQYKVEAQKYYLQAKGLDQKAAESQDTQYALAARKVLAKMDKALKNAKALKSYSDDLRNFSAHLAEKEQNENAAMSKSKLAAKQLRKKAKKLERKARKAGDHAYRLQVQGAILALQHHQYVKRKGLADDVAPNSQMDIRVRASYDAIRDQISIEPCLIYGWKKCPWCTKAKELLDKLNIQCKKIDFNSKIPEEAMKSQILSAFTGQNSVPNIFVKSVHVGGFAQLQSFLRRCLRNSSKVPPRVCKYFQLENVLLDNVAGQ